MDRVKRKKKEEEEALLNKAYAQFCEEFVENPVNASTGKSFIRGAIVNAPETVAAAKESSTNIVYKPKIEIPTKLANASSFEQAKKIAEEKAKRIVEEARRSIPSAASRPPRPGIVQQKSRMSNLESFKEELRSWQEEREKRRTLRSQMESMGVEKEVLDRIAPLIDNPYLHGTGEYDNDPNTTNIYISNLALDITIDDLYETFGSFGPLASAKIHFPREEDRKRDHLCGFIAYMVRRDTDRAMRAMQGQSIKGSEVRLSLAKPVTIPPQPVYIPPALTEYAMPDPPTGLPFNAKPRKRDLDAFSSNYELPQSGDPHPEPGNGKEEFDKMLRNAVVRVVVPTERNLLAIIHRTIEFVIREGPLFEAMLMSRERPSPLYRFLFDNCHPAHVYYRWKLYSMLQGDSPQSWRVARFRMFDGGSWWQPPPIDLLSSGMPECLYHTAYKGVDVTPKSIMRPHKRRYSSSDEEDEDRKAQLKAKWRGVLSTAERDTLEDILRSLLPEKISIADAMLWCADHASCAKEVTQCIYESLTIDETPLHKKIARLYLIADILANCAARVRDVFYYRQFIGDRMTDIFKELNKTYEAIEARLKAEQFKQRVMLCFRTWEDNSIYPTEFLIQLQNIFLGLTKEAGSDEDIDGIPIEESEVQVSVKQDPIFDDNGEEDIDGVPIDEDDDVESNSKKVASFKPSQWNTVDPSVVASQAVTTSKWDLLENGKDEDGNSVDNDEYGQNGEDIDGVPMDEKDFGSEDGEYRDDEDVDSLAEASTSKSVCVAASMKIHEERRKILREIEVKVVKYQDDLEQDRCIDVAARVVEYRASLMKKMEENLCSLNQDRSLRRKDREYRSRQLNDGRGDDRNYRGKERSKFRSSENRDRDRELDRNKDREKIFEKSRTRDRSRSREREWRYRRERSTEKRRR